LPFRGFCCKKTLITEIVLDTFFDTVKTIPLCRRFMSLLNSRNINLAPRFPVYAPALGSRKIKNIAAAIAIPLEIGLIAGLVIQSLP